MAKDRVRFTEILLRKGKLTAPQMAEAAELSRSRGLKLVEAIVQTGHATEEDVVAAVAEEHRMGFVPLEGVEIPSSIIEMIPESVARENTVIPVGRTNGILRVAVADPDDLNLVDKLRFMLNQEVERVLSPREAIVQSINKHYGQTETQSVDSMMQEFTETAVETTELESATSDESSAPIVRLVELIMNEALNLRASDIHIEPFDDRVRIRYRIDGRLVERDNAPRRLLGAMMTRLKIMGSIDITEKRRPQDGRIKWKSSSGKELDIRVSMLPTNHGQSCVMRLLDKDNIKLSVKDLGFSEADYRRFARIIRRPNGIFLVTGPTGSGKTTTLYAAMNELNRPDKKIITAEDPVEYYLPGINQCEVRSDIGMTFQAIIRAMLRQAPNIILVGEIRDKETADIAVQASLTGHLVFSTLHTNDAASSITRLVDIGVAPYLVAASLVAILAQRLVRINCSKCKAPYMPGHDELDLVKLPPERIASATFARGTGCNNCSRTGYRGRRGIFELMPVSNAVRELTFRREPHMNIREEARRGGMTTLYEDGIAKALRGLTTIREVYDTAGTGETGH
jgi:type IV pilus assembly protein PilB